MMRAGTTATIALPRMEVSSILVPYKGSSACLLLVMASGMLILVFELDHHQCVFCGLQRTGSCATPSATSSHRLVLPYSNLAMHACMVIFHMLTIVPVYGTAAMQLVFGGRGVGDSRMVLTRIWMPTMVSSHRLNVSRSSPCTPTCTTPRSRMVNSMPDAMTGSEISNTHDEHDRAQKHAQHRQPHERETAEPHCTQRVAGHPMMPAMQMTPGPLHEPDPHQRHESTEVEVEEPCSRTGTEAGIPHHPIAGSSEPVMTADQST